MTPDPFTNRLTDPGYAYDLSGNMTNDGLNTMTYNGESRVASSAQAGTTTTYAYDGELPPTPRTESYDTRTT